MKVSNNAKTNLFIIVVAMVITLLIALLFVLPSDLGEAHAELIDYSALVSEFTANSSEWHELEAQQDLLHSRNNEIRDAFCEAGLCDF